MKDDLRQALLAVADSAPTRRLYTFLDESGREESVVTYGEMATRALAVADDLTQRGLAGERALLLYKPEPEYMVGFLGCLLADVVAVPAYPPIPSRLDRTMPRVQTIARSSGTKVVLSTSDIMGFREMFRGLAPAVADLDWVATETLAARPRTDRLFQRSADEIAFLQYTSGSTGEPRGVMISHAALAANTKVIAEYCRLTPDDVGVTWLPPYHDMGLVGSLLTAIQAGLHLVWMSPITFLKRPVRWLEAMSKYRAAATVSPDFGYRLCVRKVSEADRAKLDLRAWRMAGNGAEPVRADTIESFVGMFGPQGFNPGAFHPCYGLAEATLAMSYGGGGRGAKVCHFERAALEKGTAVKAEAAPHTIALVACGSALPGSEMIIADPETLVEAPPATVGEVLARGVSMAAGLLNQPELTAATFRARVRGRDEDWMRTGDLGFMLDGELFLVGRLKDLVIIRGRNIAPNDIEAIAEAAHGWIRPGTAAAFSVERAGEEQLVVVAEFERRHPPTDAAGIAAEAAWAARRKDVELPEHQGPADVPADVTDAIRGVKDSVGQEFGVAPLVVLTKVGSALKTSSGKIQRARTRELYIAGELEAIAKG